MIACPADIVVSNDLGICGAAVTYNVTASDNCPGETLTQTAGPVSGATFPIGVTTVSYTVTDAAGNTADCSFTVTVNDTEPPVANCTDVTIQLDANGNASITTSDVNGGASDNCGVAFVSASPLTFDCSNVGTNVVLLTVIDNSGNIDTCQAIVTVEDNLPPVANCQDITITTTSTTVSSNHHWR